MRIKPSTDTPSTQPHSSQSPMPIDDHAMLQSRFERALKENPDQTKPQPNETNNQTALEAKKPFTENYSERSLASLHSTGSNQRKTAEKSAFAQSGDAVTENKNNESDTSSPIALNTQDKTPSDMDAHMKSDIRIPTTGDKKLPIEPSNKREKNADEQDAFERLVEDHDDSKTELATAKTAELHESTQSPKDTKHIPTVGTKPNTMETVSDALASTVASTTVASAASAASASLASHPVTSTVHKTATKTEVNKHEDDSSLGFNSRNLKTPIPNDEHPKASKGERTLLDRAMLDSEKSSDKPMHQPVTTPITQGDVILKGISTPQPTQPTREVSQLIQQLVDKVYVALPTASNEKEVRLFLSEGQLKGGEIHIKLDSQGYSVTIRQEHALSIINQQARQDLAERLNRMGFEQPLRVSISEQTSQHGHTQQDQQQSRQQRSVYEEWQPEADQ
ncbi:type III secretion system needle length determinant VscP [Vibrio parahaemolyticus]|uniref:type III secretion system needle length determinant VscP n=1 Tax=Vibrio parahaemolyticus TaxID=670 RepID=UPI00232EDD1B|nr:type III secretion system needle length determinant VscP [Vibrio parahaemolyticus]MDB6194069.1 type III secretion system needle length determinant VscP [Vibrio parahaemolyticus]